MKRRACLVGIAALAMAATANADPLEGLRFLLGTWHGGTPGGRGSDIFQMDLDGHILQRRSRTPVPAENGRPDASMQAYLTVYPTGEADSLECWRRPKIDPLLRVVPIEN